MELRVCGLIAAFAISCLFNSAPAQAQLAQQGPKLAGANAPAGGLQGYAVSLSGDGNTAIVGAPQSFSRDFGSLTGAAWVFTHSGGVWMQQQEILSPSGIDFGFSVALSADGNTAIIGAPTDVSDNEGYAAVYGRSGGVWVQQGILANGGLYTNSGLLEGYSVSLSADGNTAIIGAPGVAIYNGPFQPSPTTGAGLVFTRSTGGEWAQQAQLIGIDINGMFSGTFQGFFVSLSGDGNTAIVSGA